ncbi:MAG: oligosaccharide flippase family protein, partial [Desulfonatronovibrionaceae bacterium]
MKILKAGFLSSRLALGRDVKKIASNSGWLVLDRLVRLGGGLVLSVILARYLGPDKFGILSYALSVVAFLGAFVYLGLSGLVVREVVQKPGENHLTLGATFGLKSAGALLAYFIVLGLAFLSKGSKLEFLTLLIVGLALFFRPFDTIDFWFQSRVQSRFTVLARISGFVLSALVKVGLVAGGAGLVPLAMAGSLEFFLSACFLVLVYRLQGNSILKWKFSLKRAGQLLGRSWILLLSGFLGLVYLKVDQIMLRWLKGPEEVGIYSVASMLSE